MAAERINHKSSGTGRLRRADFDIVADTIAEIDAEITKFHRYYPPQGYMQTITRPVQLDDGRWSVHVHHDLNCD